MSNLLGYWDEDRMQRLFHQHGPEEERFADWKRSNAEPWRTFRELLDARR